MRIKWNTVTLLLVAVVIASFGLGSVAGADARRGERFSDRWCSQCHGVRPDQASPYAQAPSFSDLAASPATTRDSLTVSLRTTPHWTMPKIKLKSANINDVVSYILSLRNPR